MSHPVLYESESESESFYDDDILSMIAENGPGEPQILRDDLTITPLNLVMEPHNVDFNVYLPPIFTLTATQMEKLIDLDKKIKMEMKSEEDELRHEYSTLVAQKSQLLLELNATRQGVFSLDKDNDLLNSLARKEQKGTLARQYYFFSSNLALASSHGLAWDEKNVPVSSAMINHVTDQTPLLWIPSLVHYTLVHGTNLNHFNNLSSLLLRYCRAKNMNQNINSETRFPASQWNAFSHQCQDFSSYTVLVSSDPKNMPLLLPRQVPNLDMLLSRIELVFALCLCSKRYERRNLLNVFVHVCCDFGARKFAYSLLARLVSRVFPILVLCMENFCQEFLACLDLIKTTVNGVPEVNKKHDFELQFAVLQLVSICVRPDPSVRTAICNLGCSLLAGKHVKKDTTPLYKFLKPITKSLALTFGNTYASLSPEFYSAYYRVCIFEYVLLQPFGNLILGSDSHVENVAGIISCLDQLHTKAFNGLKTIGLDASKMQSNQRNDAVRLLTDVCHKIMLLRSRFHSAKVISLADIFYG